MDKNVRIAIIGGGPAGLAAGRYLEQKGYQNYTIFERTDHVGGKCHSPSYHGKRYEMGAIRGVPNYYAIQDIRDWTGVKPDGPVLFRNYKYPDGRRNYSWKTRICRSRSFRSRSGNSERFLKPNTKAMMSLVISVLLRVNTRAMLLLQDVNLCLARTRI